MSKSIPDLFFKKCELAKSQTGILFKQDEQWVKLSFEQIAQKVSQIANALIPFTGAQDTVVILSQTRYEWLLCDLGILSAGCITVPIYHSSTPEDIQFIIQDSGAQILFIENKELLQKILLQDPNLESVQKIILFSGNYTHNKVVPLQDFLDSVKENLPLDQRLNLLSENSIATVVYTSGTTGKPKGVVLTHGNLLYEAIAIDQLGVLKQEYTQLIFLPLSHIFAKVMALSWIQTLHTLAFAESMEKAVDNLSEVHPHILAAVPRVYEKIRNKIIENIKDKNILIRFLFSNALKHIKKQADLTQQGYIYESIFFDFYKKAILKPIGHQLEKRLGGNVAFLVSGGAPLSLEVAYFFEALGQRIFEGYGLTETSGASCVNLPHAYQIGTVGKPIKGTFVKIHSDGEIMMKGPGVFKEYWQLPQATKEAFDFEDWFKTGDMGELTPQGFLRITDRKKDMIITAGGKKIAPQKLENLLKSTHGLISHVLVYGDQKPYVTALITLDSKLLKGTPALSKQKQIDQAVAKVNQRLAKFEQIKKWVLLAHDFEIGKELTPTLKIKRNYCFELYKTELKSMY